MKLETINIDGKKNFIEVVDKIFVKKINKQLISNVLYKVNTNKKGRKAKTKQKNEIIGSTAKIYAQKGTGNARHASRKAPIFVGGGVAHGPKGESKYKKRKINKSEKKLSVLSLITEKKNTNKFSRSKLYSQIKNCEKTILKLETEKEQIEIKMTKPDFYLARNTQMIKELSDELSNINNDLEKQEALWFDLQSKL